MNKISFILFLITISGCSYKARYFSSIDDTENLIKLSKQIEESKIADKKIYAEDFSTQEITASVGHKKEYLSNPNFAGLPTKHPSPVIEEKSVLKKSPKTVEKIKYIKAKKALNKNITLSLILLGVGIGIIALTILVITNPVLYYVCLGLSISLLYTGISNLIRSLLYQN